MKQGYTIQGIFHPPVHQTNSKPNNLLLTALFVLAVGTWGFSQLTIRLTGLPANTPDQADIFAAGNFNGWNPADPNRQFNDLGNNVYSLTFTPAPGMVEFKMTRGNWESVETDLLGNAQPSHKIFYSGQPKTVEVAVLNWNDHESLNDQNGNTPNLGTVSVIENEFYMPQLGRTRRIWIYLPPDYNANTSKYYPVVYAQDGQNLFNASLSYAGEWFVDESLNTLFQNGDPGCIIIGIENGGNHRLNEYAPWTNPAYGGGEGEEYIEFIINTLKPHVDANFRTLPGREHTALMGSSMGGLVAMYGLMAHQDVFSKAAVFSPAFWFNGNKMEDFIQNVGKQHDVRVYFLAGGAEPPYISNDVEEVVETMLSVGFSMDEINISNPTDGDHTEWSWSREFPAAYNWLFQEDQAVVGTDDPVTNTPDGGKDSGPGSSSAAVAAVSLSVYPNPATDWVQLKGDGMDGLVMVRIMSMDGRLVKQSLQIGQQPIDVADFHRGNYALQVISLDGSTQTLQFAHQ
jgi:predicted alpha/beta superfamily hydrolase